MITERNIHKIESWIKEMPSHRGRRALRGCMAIFMNDDIANTFKPVVFGAGTTPITLSGAFTTGISIAADGTTAISVTSAFTGVNMISLAGTGSTSGIIISGACAIPLNITGAFTTGITIAADGTTGISITSAFSGTTGLSFAGTASGDGILISGVCADAIHISGANTVSGLHISGDQVIGILFATTAAADAAFRVTIPTGITLGAGVDINATSTGTVTSGLTMQGTGTFTTGITLSATAITTGMLISATTVTTGLTISSACSGDGILVSGACADAVQVSGTNTVSGVHVSGTQVIGLWFEGTYSDSVITIGTSGSPISLAAQPDHAIDIYTTSPSTDAGNSVRPIHMTSTMTGIGGVGGRAEFEMTSNVALGGWANALKGYFNMGDACTVSGLGSAVLAEMKLPGASLGGVGSYGVLEIELVTQASGVTGGAPVAFQWMQVSGDGTATADFEDTGYLQIIKGLTEGTGNIFSAGADVAAAATLRILVGATPYYILLGAGEST